MSHAPNFTRLLDSCLFCNPERHGQGEQKLLSSANFYVFAGVGALTDGYLIIAPHSCADNGFHSLSMIPSALLDELRFLRELVAHYYRDRYGSGGMSFEHGRAGACLTGDGENPLCHHAHLCCYPTNHALWADITGLAVEPVSGVYQLASRTSRGPYLYLERYEVNLDAPERSARREVLAARIVRLNDTDKLESQYLRRLLAAHLGIAERWDWQEWPTLDSVRKTCEDFQEWLRTADRYETTMINGVAQIDVGKAIRRLNVIGNNSVAEAFDRVWGDHLQHQALARFVGRLPVRQSRLRVLDAACGPGRYLRALHHLGLDVVGGDIADSMIANARACLASELAGSSPPHLVRMDVAHPPFLAGTIDGIWFSAGLVHLTRSEAEAALAGFGRILRDDGTLYVSTQIGQGLTVRWEGRTFVYFTEAELRALFDAADFSIVQQWDAATDRGSLGDTRVKVWKHYLLCKRTKPNEQAPSVGGDTLGDLGEHAILQRLQRRLPSVRHGNVVLEIGDDATAFVVPEGDLVVASVDPCPQPVLEILDGPDLWVNGWYSMIINISDLAAMGARPVGALLSVEAPPDLPVAELDRFYDGIQAAATRFGCPVIGGNVKDSSRFNCVGVVLGTTAPDRLLRRDGARPGDAVVVLGEMGTFWAAVLQSLHGIEVTAEQRATLRRALREPVPRLMEALALAENGWSRCAMDSSDGLTACFYGIAKASSMDLHIDLTGTPATSLVEYIGQSCAIDVRKLQLAWGDWQLVATIPQVQLPQVRARMAELNCPMWEVGWVTDGNGAVWLHDEHRTDPLNNVASERFTARSYFTHGLDQFAWLLRHEPLIAERT